MITPQEEKELTESKYWKPEIGSEHRVVLTEWHFERRVFLGDLQQRDEAEARATFVSTVVALDGQELAVPKEFSSGNRKANILLMAAVRLAEREGRDYIKLHMTRLDQRTYQIVDLTIVEKAVARAEDDAPLIGLHKGKRTVFSGVKPSKPKAWEP